MTDNEIRHNGVSFSLKRGRTLIYRATIRELDNPECIRFLLSRKQKKVAVQVCEVIDKDSFRVPDFSSDKKIQYEISSMNFLNIIYGMMNWDPQKAYHLRGYLVPKYRLVLYDLTEAKAIKEEEFVDPESGGESSSLL
jgi:hypothetical protein